MMNQCENGPYPCSYAGIAFQWHDISTLPRLFLCALVVIVLAPALNGRLEAQVAHNAILSAAAPAPNAADSAGSLASDVSIPAGTETTLIASRVYPPGSPNYEKNGLVNGGYNIYTSAPYCTTAPCPDLWEVQVSFAPIVILNNGNTPALVTINAYLDEPYVYQSRATIAPNSYFTFNLGTLALGFVGIPPATPDFGMPLARSIYANAPVIVRRDPDGPSGAVSQPPAFRSDGSVEYNTGTYQAHYSSSCTYASDATSSNVNCARVWGLNVLFIPMQYVQ